MYRFILLAILAGALVMSATCVGAWEVSYEGNALPNDPGLGSSVWTGWGDLSLSSVSNGVLRTVDPWSDKMVYFFRESVPRIAAGTPVTVEARLRVIASEAPVGIWSGPSFGVQTYGSSAKIELLTGGLRTCYGEDNAEHVYSANMSLWRTIRLALSPDEQFCVWLDGAQAFSGLASNPGQDGVFFGSSYPQATQDIEWDYVRYSKEYLPIPEPSCLTALSLALAGVGVGRLRRRR